MNSKETQKKMRQLNAYLRQQRQMQDITRTELAVKLGYKWPNFISMLENSSSQFPLERWRDFADALSVPRHEFLKLVLCELFPQMLPYLSFHAAEEKVLDC